MFNKLESIAKSPHPRTPVLNCLISRALQKENVKTQVGVAPYRHDYFDPAHLVHDEPSELGGPVVRCGLPSLVASGRQVVDWLLRH